jgi:2-succinyl-6-hydroxy-2,4-cyclohexadiene-1-carboxylate synthase
MPSPIVFLHGFLGSPESFDAVKLLIPDAHLAYNPAIYGHAGRQSCLPNHDYDAETDRLLGLIRGRFQSSPVHLVGYSMGGRLALGMLLKATSQFRSATLISARRGLETAEDRTKRCKSDGQWAELLRTVPLNQFLDTWEARPLFATMSQLAPGVRTKLREQRLRHDPDALAHAMMALSLANMPSFANGLSSIQCPVLLMVGQKDPYFVELSADLAQRIPNSRSIVVSDAGHNLPLERPEEVAVAICEEMNHVER